MRNTLRYRRKQRDWRPVMVSIMLGLLAAILFWVVVLWTALHNE